MEPIDYVKANDLILRLQNAEIELANTVAIRDEAVDTIPGLEAHIQWLKAEVRSTLSPIMTEDEPEQPELIFKDEEPETPEAPVVVETPAIEESAPVVEEIADVVVEEPETPEEPVIEETPVEEIVDVAVEETIEEPVEEVVDTPVVETEVEVAPVEETVEDFEPETPEEPTVADEVLAEMDAEEASVEVEAETSEEPTEPVDTSTELVETVPAVITTPETPVEVEAEPVEEVVEETPVEVEPVEAPAEPEVYYDGDPGDGTEELISFGLFPMAPYDYNREFHPILTSKDGLNFTYNNVTLSEGDIRFRMLPAQGTSGGLEFVNQRNRAWRDGTYITVVKTPPMKPGMVAVPLSITSEGSDAFGYTGENGHKFAIELIGGGLVRFTLDNGEGPIVLTQAAYSWGNSELHCEISRQQHTVGVQVEVYDVNSGVQVLTGTFDKTKLPEDAVWPFDVPMHPQIIYTVDQERWNAQDATVYDFVHAGYAILKEDTHNPAV